MAKIRNRRPYLTKRILVSAAKTGIRKAAKETMDIMGFTVVAQDGWVVKKYADGRVEQIAPIQSSQNSEILLD